MSSYTKDRVSDILYNDSPFLPESYCIVIDADRQGSLMSYYYEHDAARRKIIQDGLIALYRGQTAKRHNRTFTVESVVLAAINIYTVYEYGFLAGMGSLVLAVIILGTLCVAHSLMLRRDTSKIEANIRQAYPAYRQYQSDSLFRKSDLSFKISIFDNDAAPLSVLACKKVYKQWSKIDREGELAERARAEMSDRIIEAAYAILQNAYHVPLYDDASKKMQRAFRDKLHEGYVMPLIGELAGIAKDFKAACQKHDQAKKEEARRQKELDEAALQATREFADEQVRQVMNGPL